MSGALVDTFIDSFPSVEPAIVLAVCEQLGNDEASVREALSALCSPGGQPSPADAVGRSGITPPQRALPVAQPAAARAAGRLPSLAAARSPGGTPHGSPPIQGGTPSGTPPSSGGSSEVSIAASSPGDAAGSPAPAAAAAGGSSAALAGETFSYTLPDGVKVEWKTRAGSLLRRRGGGEGDWCRITRLDFLARSQQLREHTSRASGGTVCAELPQPGARQIGSRLRAMALSVGVPFEIDTAEMQAQPRRTVASGSMADFTDDEDDDTSSEEEEESEDDFGASESGSLSEEDERTRLEVFQTGGAAPAAAGAPGAPQRRGSNRQRASSNASSGGGSRFSVASYEAAGDASAAAQRRQAQQQQRQQQQQQQRQRDNSPQPVPARAEGAPSPPHEPQPPPPARSPSTPGSVPPPAAQQQQQQGSDRRRASGAAPAAEQRQRHNQQSAEHGAPQQRRRSSQQHQHEAAARAAAGAQASPAPGAEPARQQQQPQQQPQQRGRHSPPQAQFQPGDEALTRHSGGGEGVNFHPQRGADALGRIRNNESVTVICVEGSYAQVRWRAREGWVKQRHLVPQERRRAAGGVNRLAAIIDEFRGDNGQRRDSQRGRQPPSQGAQPAQPPPAPARHPPPQQQQQQQAGEGAVPRKHSSRQGRRASGQGGDKERKEMDALLECCVCISAPKDTLLLPCRHLCLCAECGELCTFCPLCRTPVVERMQVFV